MITPIILIKIRKRQFHLCALLPQGLWEPSQRSFRPAQEAGGLTIYLSQSNLKVIHSLSLSLNYMLEQLSQKSVHPKQ